MLSPKKLYHTSVLEDQGRIEHDSVDSAPLLEDLHGDGGDKRQMIGLVTEQHRECVGFRRAGLILQFFLFHLIQFSVDVLRATKPLKGGSSSFRVILLDVEEPMERHGKGIELLTGSFKLEYVTPPTG